MSVAKTRCTVNSFYYDYQDNDDFDLKLVIPSSISNKHSVQMHMFLSCKITSHSTARLHEEQTIRSSVIDRICVTRNGSPAASVYGLIFR